MGSRGQYITSNRFTLYFESHYYEVGAFNGVKVLQFNDRANSALPEYAKTAEAYLSVNKDGEMLHLRIFRDHFPVMDIDVGHSHHYGKADGFVHVHDFGKDVEGHPLRHTGRPITASEFRKYGKIISQMKGSIK